MAAHQEGIKIARLKYSEPIVGTKNSVADPLIPAALSEVMTAVNGQLNAENIESNSLGEGQLNTSLKNQLKSFVGLPLESKKSIVATEQERTSAIFGVMTTPDEVEVTLPENGLIGISYQATWRATKSRSGQAAVFLGANQLKVAALGKPETVEAVFGGEGNHWTTLASSPVGLVSGGNEGAVDYSGDVTTGQLVGVFPLISYAVGGVPYPTITGLAATGGPCYVFAAAGTYKITVQYKAEAGSIKVKNRKLWAWIVG